MKKGGQAKISHALFCIFQTDPEVVSKSFNLRDVDLSCIKGDDAWWSFRNSENLRQWNSLQLSQTMMKR